MEEGEPSRMSPDSPSSSFRSLACSSTLSTSIWEDSDDFSGYAPQSEYEEIPSFRWLPDGLHPAAAPSETILLSSWSEGFAPLCKCRAKKDERRDKPFKSSRGENCLFVSAGRLVAREGDQVWRCVGYHSSSWHHVELLRSYYVDIRGIIDTATLARSTEYAVYLLFRFSMESFGFGLQEASLKIGAQASSQNVCVAPEGCGIARSVAQIAKIASTPQEVGNRWASVEMGRFSTGRRSGPEERKLLISFKEGEKLDRNSMSWAEQMEVLRWKEGLVIAGVVLQPRLSDALSHGILVQSLESLSLK